MRRVDIDVRDATFWIGLALVGVGLYGFDWRVAAAGVGGLLVYLGLWHGQQGSD